jgi:ribonuclease Z
VGVKKATELGVEWSLRWLGTGGPGSSPRLGMPSALLIAGAEAHLFNAGDGTFSRLMQYVGMRPLTSIWLASCRNQFVSGLPGVLDGLSAQSESLLPKTIYGPYGLRELMPHVRGLCDYSVASIEWKEVGAVEHVEHRFGVISCVPVGKSNAVPTIGFRIAEFNLPGRFDPDAAISLGVKPGPDFGRLTKGGTIKGVRPDQVMGPPRPGRRIALSWAGRSRKALVALMKEAQLASVAAPFIDERQGLARQAGYLTGVEAAAYATEAEVEVLLLHHIASNVQIAYARDEAAQAHQNVRVSQAGDLFSIPLYGTGPVTVAPWRYNSPSPAPPTSSGPPPVRSKRTRDVRPRSSRRAP